MKNRRPASDGQLVALDAQDGADQEPARKDAVLARREHAVARLRLLRARQVAHRQQRLGAADRTAFHHPAGVEPLDHGARGGIAAGEQLNRRGVLRRLVDDPADDACARDHGHVGGHAIVGSAVDGDGERRGGRRAGDHARGERGERRAALQRERLLERVGLAGDGLLLLQLALQFEELALEGVVLPGGPVQGDVVDPHAAEGVGHGGGAALYFAKAPKATECEHGGAAR